MINQADRDGDGEINCAHYLTTRYECCSASGSHHHAFDPTRLFMHSFALYVRNEISIN